MDTGLTLVVAKDWRNAIGYQGKTPWDLPSDRRFFKETTSGHTVIMGRKTHEAIFNFLKHPLPGRRCLVLSKTLPASDGAEVFRTVSGILDAVCKETEAGKPVFVIGGEEIYKLFLPMATKLIVTQVHAVISKADAYFPNIGADWKLTDKTACMKAANDEYPFEIMTFEKVQR